MNIAQFIKGSYTDQYGYEHECYFVKNQIEVERTDQFIEWLYYTETLRDYIWISQDNRKFRAFTQTDFGPSLTPYSELEVEGNVIFYRYDPKYKSYAGAPLLNLENNNERN